MKRLLSLSLILGVIFTGCANTPKSPSCDVYVSGNQVHVVIDLPAEGSEYHDTHNLVPSGMSSAAASMSIESGGSSVQYSQTGNSYLIGYTLNYADGEIQSYDISISGSVYGDEEFTCTK